MLPNVTRDIATSSLIVGILACIGSTIMFPVLFTSVQQTSSSSRSSFSGSNGNRVLIQNGTLTFEIFYGSTIDSVDTTYEFYVNNHTFEVHVATPPRELTVPPDSIVSASYLTIRLHLFTPTITPLNTAAMSAYNLYPLSAENVAAILPQGPCYDDNTCLLTAWHDPQPRAINSIVMPLEDAGQHGYYEFYMQTAALTNQDWTNYTINIVAPLNLTIYGA